MSPEFVILLLQEGPAEPGIPKRVTSSPFPIMAVFGSARESTEFPVNEKSLSRAIDQAFPASLIRFSLIALATLVCTWAFLPF